MRTTSITFLCGALLVGLGAAAVAWTAGTDADRERKDAARARHAVAATAAAAMLPPQVDELAREAPALLARLVREPAHEGAAVYVRDGDGWLRRVHVGDELPTELAPPPETNRRIDGGVPVVLDEIALAPIRDDRARTTALLGLRRRADAPAAPSPFPWLAAVIAAVVGGWIVSRRIGRPVHRMTSTALRACGTPAVEIARLAAPLAPLEHAVAALVHRHELQRSEVEESVRRRTQQLEAQNRQKDEFLANTVHELRTPLTTVLASLEMLRDGFATSPEDQAEFLEQATVACRHLMFIVNDLLDTAALEAGKLHLVAVPCFTREILDDAERMLRPAASARGMELRVEHPDGDPRVLGDRNRILQIVFNLVGNAMKFSPQSGRIDLRCSVTPLGVAFEIEDEGYGVPLQTRSKLFTRFGRAHAGDAKASSVGGTGIGLYLCKSLVEQMRGSIGYRDRAPEQGSVFWFTLPLARTEAPAHAAAGEPRAPHD